MKPGQTVWPPTSTVRAAGSSAGPMATIRPSLTPTSAGTGAPPLPSTTTPPRSRRSSTSPTGQQRVDRRLDDGAPEEARVGAGVEAHRVGEGELLERRLVDPSVVHHLPRLLQHLG